MSATTASQRAPPGGEPGPGSPPRSGSVRGRRARRVEVEAEAAPGPASPAEVAGPAAAAAGPAAAAAPWQDLPDVVLIKVFQRLAMRQDACLRSNVSMVCVRWKRLVHHVVMSDTAVSRQKRKYVPPDRALRPGGARSEPRPPASSVDGHFHGGAGTVAGPREGEEEDDCADDAVQSSPKRPRAGLPRSPAAVAGLLGAAREPRRRRRRSASLGRQGSLVKRGVRMLTSILEGAQRRLGLPSPRPSAPPD